MSMSKKKLLTKANAMSDALDELEKVLEPLFAQSLPEAVASLDSLQQAKMQVLVPYLINDLIFIYLRTRGIDPKTHPVVAELDRVRQYFAKIKNAEEASKKRTSGIDKAAAGRLIKHGIAQIRTPVASAAEAGPSQPTTFVAHRVTEKMKERERYQRKLKDDSSDSEDDVLAVIDDDVDDEIADARASGSKGKGKEVDESHAEAAQRLLDSIAAPPTNKKKRRRPIDPFGLPDDGTASGTYKSPKKKSKNFAAVIDGETPLSSRASSVSAADTDAAAVKDKPRKKNRKSVSA